MSVSRREMLKLGALGGAATFLPLERMASTKGSSSVSGRLASSKLPKPYTLPFRVPPVADLTAANTKAWTKDGKPYLRVAMSEFVTEIIPGLRTPVWGYNNSVPGPTIKVSRGRPVVVRQVNNLPTSNQFRYQPWTSVHLHGSASLPEYDGYANDITNPGQYKDYHYPNIQDARTLWYHDHGVHHTASNVYMGMAGQYHMYDEWERSLPLPSGDYDPVNGGGYDIPLIVMDAMFSTTGAALYDDHSQSGVYGDVILVNGVPWPLMKVEPRKYRFRMLNASVSRSYRWKLSTGQPFTVIATDAGLMPTAQQVTSFRQGMAERYEVVIDFSGYSPGTRIELQNLSNPNNIDYGTTRQVMMFEVGDRVARTSDNSVPALLNPNRHVMDLTDRDPDTGNSYKKVRLDFIRANGLWTINGKTWHDVEDSGWKDVVSSPKLDDVEVWELRNTSGGWFHPVHIHLIDFRILDRNGKPPMTHELGPKDVAYVGENETVRVAMRFTPQIGKYMVHCHNLVHEDHDMMTQFEVLTKDGSSQGDDPVESAKCKNQPEDDA